MQTPAGTGYELKLAHALVLNAAILAAAYRFARRRFGDDAIAATFHALLGWFFVQYAAVGVTGLCGILGPMSLTIAGLLMAAALWLGAGRDANMTRDDATAVDAYLTWGCFLFLVGYAWAVLDFSWSNPPKADDEITYHLPAAVRWLQTGRLVLHETWYFNPANTYSPLAGSAFAAWWIAPFNNDVAARWMQAPALALIFFGLIELCRRMDVPATIGAPVALAAVLSRPFAAQMVMAKDDLYLAAFFVAAVASLDVRSLRSTRGVWPLGLAAGLFLATKITALLAAPILVLAADGLFRARLKARDWLVVAGLVLLIAGPWFVRNAVLTGNPIYPTQVGPLHGMFRPAPSERLRSALGVWSVLTNKYLALPTVLAAIVLIGWLAALVLRFGELREGTIARTALVGPVVGVAAFVLLAPFAEVRFLNPTYLLLFAALAVGCAALPVPAAARAALLAAALVATLATNFPAGQPVYFTSVGLAGAAGAAAVIAACRRWPKRATRLLAGTAAGATIVLFLAAYVSLNANVDAHYVTTEFAWKHPGYGRVAMGESWAYVRNEVPSTATLAYANTHFTYPLFGFDHRRRVIYAPVRPGVRHLHDLPSIPGRVPGERLQGIVVRNMNEGADRDVWLKNLDELGASHLYVAKSADVPNPPELAFARSMPARFALLFENDAAAIFRITR